MKRKIFLFAFPILLLGLGGFAAKEVVFGKATDELVVNENLMSDGEFVRGPNAEGFNVESYLKTSLQNYSEFQKEIDNQSEMYSVNPKLMITLIDLQYKDKDLSTTSSKDFYDISENLAIDLTDAYYDYINEAVEDENLRIVKDHVTDSGYSIKFDEVNAATYAMIMAMSNRMDQDEMTKFVKTNGEFEKRFSKLFPETNPLDESNLIDYEIVSGKVKPEKFSLLNSVIPKAYAQVPTSPAMQFAYPVGQSWVINGVHSTNMSGIDFSPSSPFPGWLTPQNNTTATDYKVVAVADGTAHKSSNCLVYVDHGGGWKTKYYHLENVQFTQDVTVSANDTIAYLANTLSEAVCSGGSASGRHVHFGLMYNGAFTALDGSSFSGWEVNVDTTTTYSTDCTKMYLKKGETTKCPYNSIMNDGIGDGCTPTSGQDWIIDGQTCEVSSNLVADRNVVVKNNSELKLLANSSLDMDLNNYSIQVEPYGKITIDSTAKLF